MSAFFDQITNQIIAAIEEGAGEFLMPWHRTTGIGTPANAITGRPYRGSNTLMLWAAAAATGFTSGKWATYRQWAAAGAQVRKGERSTMVMLWKPIGARDPDVMPDIDHNGFPRGGLVARAFRVFNADQVDGYVPMHVPAIDASAKLAHAEAFFEQIPAELWFGGDAAFYDRSSDMVSLPSFGSFFSAESYYSVLSHELIHWTGAKHRLDRDLSGRFGSESYGMEELIAELGAAFVSAHLGLAVEARTNHAPYIASWLRVLRSDTRAIVTAASAAQAAADFLFAYGTGGTPDLDPMCPPFLLEEMTA